MRKNDIMSSRTNTSLMGEDISFTGLESYKSTRTNIIFALPGDGCKTVLITSSFPREGKTTTCVNLGIVFAQTGQRILIIDCDLRKPRVHKLFRVNNDVGVTDVLVGIKTIEEVIKHDEETNVDFITCGTVPKTPAELLASAKMDEFLDSIKDKYDYIFIDAPPVMVVTDALVIAPKVSGTFVVARQDYTDRDGLKEALAKLNFIGCNPTGIILNGTKKKKSGYRYRYYNKYGYRIVNYRDSNTNATTNKTDKK